MWPYKKTLLSFLICVFSLSGQMATSAVLPRGELSRVSTVNMERLRQSGSCGNWAWDFPADLKDPRLILEQNDLIDPGVECRTEISLINNTGIPLNVGNIISTDVLSYSLELSIRTENARLEWKFPYNRLADPYFAVQSLNATFGAIPIDPQQNATIYIEGRQTWDSLRTDLALYLIYELIDWYPCIPVQESIYSAINISNQGVLDRFAQLLWDRKFVEAYREGASAFIEFYDTFLMEGRAKCAGDISEEIIEKAIGNLPSMLLESIYYSAHVTADYAFRYQGSPARLTIGYQPATPIEPALDKNNLSSVMQWIADLMKQKESVRISALIGSSGTVFAPYGIGAQPRGYNNSDEIVTALEAALRISEPICLGYDPNFGASPDKAIIYFQGLTFDQAGAGVTNDQSVTGFQFFKLHDGWELIFITPIPEGATPDPQSLTPCPGETSNPVTPLPVPAQPLDRMRAESVMEWITYGLTNGDAAVFEELLPGNYILYGTGFAGGRDQVDRDEFISMVQERIVSHPACEGYTGDDTSLTVFTSGWEPDWFFKDISNETLTFFLLNVGEGFSLTSAYFTPAPAVLDSVDGKPCPAALQ